MFALTLNKDLWRLQSEFDESFLAGLYDQIQFVFEYWIDKESSSGSKNPRVVY